MIENVAKLTAKWWRRKLETSIHDNGDESNQSQISGMLADIAARKYKPTVDQLDKFELVLTKLIIDHHHNEIWLSCDYAPCEILSEAADSAGINHLVFPWKTNTHIKGGTLKVSDGYGKPYIEVRESDFQ